MSRRQLAYVGLARVVVVVIAALLLIADLHVAVRLSPPSFRHAASALAIASETSTPTPIAQTTSAIPVTAIPSATNSARSPLATSLPGARLSSSPSATPSDPGEESLPIIYDKSGQGNAVTTAFQVPREWLIYWSYGCPDGTAAVGTLQITVYRKDVTILLETFSNPSGATKGVEHNFVGDGRYHLLIQSMCSGRVTVTPAPGFAVSPSPSP